MSESEMNGSQFKGTTVIHLSELVMHICVHACVCVYVCETVNVCDVCVCVYVHLTL